MKAIKSKLFLIVLLIALSGIGWRSITCYLQGHLKSKSGKPLNTRYHIFVTSNGHVSGKTITNLKGNFKLEFNTNWMDTAFKFYCYRSGKDTLLLKTITSFNSEEPEITFYLPKQ